MSFKTIYDNILLQDHGQGKDQENLATTLFDWIPVPCGCFNLQGELVVANNKWLELLGMEYLEEFEAFMPKWQPCETPTPAYIVNQIKKSQEVDWHQFYLVGGNSEGHLVGLNFTMKWEKDGVAVAFFHAETNSAVKYYLNSVNSVMDKMIEVEEFSQILLDASPFATAVWDSDLNPVDCNRKTLELLKISRKDEFTEHFYDFTPFYQPFSIESTQIMEQNLRMAFEKGDNTFEFTYIAADGEHLPTRITIVRVKRKGRYLAIGYMMDLKPFNEALERANEANELSDILRTASPLITNIWDDSMNLVSTSEQAIAMFGLDSQEQYIERFFELSPAFQPCGTPSDQKAKEYVKRAFGEGKVVFEWLHCDLKGELIPTEITISSFTYQGRLRAAAFTVDLRPIKLAMARKQETLREREHNEYLQMLFSTMPVSVIVYSASDKLLDCNLETVKMFGFDDKEVFMQAFGEDFLRFSPEYQPCGRSTIELTNEIKQTAVEKGRAKFEWMYFDVNGGELPIEATMARIDRGDSYLLIIYTHDLREIKRVQESERKTLQINKAMLESSPDTIGIWDENQNLVSLSKQSVDMFGVKEVDELLADFYSFAPKNQPCGRDSRKIAMQNIDKVYREGFHRFEWMHTRADGELFPVEVTCKRIELEGKNMMVSYTRDLSEVKATEAKEREINERIQLMFDAAPLIMHYWDVDFVCIDCNQTALDFAGFVTKSEYLKNISASLPEYQPCGTPSQVKWNSYLKRIFDEGFCSMDFEMRSLSGEKAHFECIGFRTTYNSNMIALTYLTDVTQLKKMQYEHNLLAIAEESNKAKSRFLARMSHEIRTPITAVLGISEIQLQNTDLPIQIEEAFAKIHNSSNSLLGIINDILDLSKIEAGKMALIQEQYSVSKLISNATHLHLAYSTGKDITFNLDIDENLPAVLLGDLVRIEQIVNNLISNAFKYTDKGSVLLSFSHTKLEGDSICLDISIKDTGIGMTKEQLKAIYKDYTRFHEKDARKIGGTGLGMSIVYSLVQLMDADIDITSSVGIGTNVTVSIPQKAIGEDILGKEATSKLSKLETDVESIVKRLKIKPEPMPYGKVLIVDDTEANLYVAKGLMSFYDLDITTCTSGYEAVNKIEQGHVYDIIFMDHMMPGMDGVETMNLIRKQDYTGPIVVLTANAMIGQAEEFMKRGFDGFMSKPIQTAHLHSVLVKHIKDKQPIEVIEAAMRSAIDKNVDIDNFQNNEEIQQKLKADFYRFAQTAKDKLNKALGDGDFKEAHILMHSLKGLARLIHENDLAGHAEQIEHAISVDEKPSTEVLQALEKELGRALAKIPKKDDDAEKLKTLELFDTLEPLLKQRSAESLEYIEQVKQIPDSAILVRQMETFEFGTALKSMNTLRAIVEEK